jgi:fructose-bisphosphate aldolase class II
MTAHIRKFFAENPGEFDPRGYLKPAREAVKNMVQHKIRSVLGCSNKI